jgi:small subunit ribosomal protein S15Ae
MCLAFGPMVIINLIYILYCYLQFGYIVLTTSAGIMDHEEARRKNVGGKVLGFFY